MLEDACRQTATVFLHSALGMGMGMVQSIVAAVLDIVPPLIPPPVWNNMPLPCAPMLTGASLEGGMPNSSVLQMCGDLQATTVSGPCCTLSQWRILPLLTSLMPCWMVCALRVYWSMGVLCCCSSQMQAILQDSQARMRKRLVKQATPCIKVAPGYVAHRCIMKPWLFSQHAFRHT